MFGDVRAPLMIGGHAHLQLLRRFEQILFVNPGSVGLPFSDWWPDRVRIAPRAEYGLLGVHEDEGRLRRRRSGAPHTTSRPSAVSRASGMPRRGRWWVRIAGQYSNS